MAKVNIKNKKKSYAFKVVVEPDGKAWHAYCPILKKYGAVTCGETEKEALKNIDEVVQMVIETLIEDGKKIPEEPKGQVIISLNPLVAVNI